ncbi:helix-turn-helix transcriptional regulator [Natrinema halophilum]|uniref:Uncharacterized protein n=1 Tax=Natrinema halophilum TaxID=1699371 RepID=A0A7D5K6Q9_9EURY|nr:hypothetical protein [Natrinema halophilum]QLG49343.1 hypothetical protein HYG82_10950 [Natrinema halophilum]
MTEDAPAPDPVELVRRGELLDALFDGPKTPGELEAETSFSRSTVHRAIESLVEQHVLTESDCGFELTGFGRVVATETAEYRTNVVTAGRLQPLLDEVDATAVTLPLDGLEGAEITRPKQAHAHVATTRITDLLAGSNRIRLFSGVISPIFLDIAYKQVLSGTEVVAIFDRRVIEILFSEYGKNAREAARTGRFEVMIYDDCPFELFLCDGTVGIAAHDDGFLRLLVESDDLGVYEWAESVFDRYRERSEYATIF